MFLVCVWNCLPVCQPKSCHTCGKAETHSESEFKFSCTRSQDTESRNPHLKNKNKIQNQKQKHASVMCLGTLAAPHLFTIQNWEQKLELLLVGTRWQIVNKKHVTCAESARGPVQRLTLQLDALVNGLDARPRCKTSACRCSAGAPGPGQCLGWSDHWSAAVQRLHLGQCLRAFLFLIAAAVLCSVPVCEMLCDVLRSEPKTRRIVLQVRPLWCHKRHWQLPPTGNPSSQTITLSSKTTTSLLFPSQHVNIFHHLL